MPTLKELGYDVEFSLWVGPRTEGNARCRHKELRQETGKVVATEQFAEATANVADVVA